jgi:hypothetical protein
MTARSTLIGLATVVCLILTPAGQIAAQQPDTVEISPAGAAALTLVFPGFGSFMAGNAKHGFMHLGVFAGAVTLVAACPKADCGNEFALALGIHAANIVWSAITAAGDARAFNESLEEKKRALRKAAVLVQPSRNGVRAGFSLSF